MEVKETIDMTIPLWEILLVCGMGAFHMIRMHFEVAALKRDMREVKRDLTSIVYYFKKRYPDENTIQKI